MPDNPSLNNSLAGLICMAATLVSVPGTILYVIGVITLLIFKTDLSNNLIAPLLLAFVGLTLFVLPIAGILSGIVQKTLSPANGKLLTLCIWLNTLALAAMLMLAVFTPQFE